MPGEPQRGGPDGAGRRADAAAGGPGAAGAGAAFSRVLLKLSGQALGGPAAAGAAGPTSPPGTAGAAGPPKAVAHSIDPETTAGLASSIKTAYGLGVQIAIVVGGGNIFRGMSAAAGGMDRTTADHIGMLATVMNALALQDALERQGVMSRVMSALEMRAVCEPYIRRRALRHLDKGRIVICAAGTGNPYFSTDSAAALRALELDVDAILMAKREYDGVYSADPEVDPSAEFIPELTHREAIERGLRVMDTTALSLCMDNQMPIYVFRMTGDNIVRVLRGERVGTVVHTPAEGVAPPLDAAPARDAAPAEDAAPGRADDAPGMQG